MELEEGMRPPWQLEAREGTFTLAPLVREDQLGRKSWVREKVKTPATVSQAETAADQLSCSGVIPMCHPGSGFGGGKGYEPMWQEPGQGGSMEPQDTPFYHPPIVS